jgi:hypothetical protein
MKSKIATIVFSGLVCISAQVLADDSTTTSPQDMQGQDAKTMQDCLAKQKAANATMTQAAMETVCKNELKKSHKKSGNDLVTGPQAPKPQP